MKKLFIKSLFFMLAFTSCSNEGWSESDKKTFIDDCINASNGVENSLEICSCGLEKAIETYPTKKAAEKAMQTMNEQEIMLLYEDCLNAL